MGNIIGSFIHGFTNVIGKLFGTPLDFLAGKHCSLKCGSTWDLICYIENFCIANLLKMLMVLVLFYIVLLFFYLLHKMGICYCMGRSLCKMIWACMVSWFSALEYGCTFLLIKMKSLKRMHRSDIEDYYSSESDESLSYHIPRFTEIRRSLSYRSRQRRKFHLQRSLRPRNHRIKVGISKNAIYVNDAIPITHHRHRKRLCTVHNIKVTQSSKFVRKRRW